jgi:hypothetical protein
MTFQRSIEGLKALAIFIYTPISGGILQNYGVLIIYGVNEIANSKKIRAGDYFRVLIEHLMLTIRVHVRLPGLHVINKLKVPSPGHF